MLITTANVTLKNFVVVDSIMVVDWGTTEGLIYNDSKDDDLAVLSEIAKVKDSLKYIIYINSDIKPVFFSLFSGINADIYDNSELINDEDILDFMVSQYGKTGMTLKSSVQEFKDLNKSLDAVLKDDGNGVLNLAHNRLWRKTVSGALAKVDTTLARADQINSDMVGIIGKAKAQADKLVDTNKEMTDQLASLNETISEFSNGISPTPMIYAAYKVPAATKRVLYIKSYSHCNYLMTFLIAYQRYLKQTMGVDSRLLLVLPNLSIYAARYKEIPRLAVESLGVMTNLNKDIYCTFEPKRDIMRRFFEGNNLLYIVVDEMYSNAIISTGAKVEKFYAVSGTSDIERFELDPSRTFFSTNGIETGYVIPYIENYRTSYTNVSARLQAYYAACKNLYNRLDKELGITK